MSGDRHSETESVELINDPDERARREAENGVRQFREAMEIVRTSIQKPDERFKLRQSMILRLHHVAMDGIHLLAGTYRNSSVKIGKSKHLPPKHVEVPDLVADMCEYVNDHWDDHNAVQLAAYILWRTNWIHPFADGNGRTARTVSYLVMNIKLNSLLPGAPTIPDQIASDKNPYYTALEKADAAEQAGVLGLSDMESMLEGMLAQQLLSATEEASL